MCRLSCASQVKATLQAASEVCLTRDPASAAYTECLYHELAVTCPAALPTDRTQGEGRWQQLSHCPTRVPFQRRGESKRPPHSSPNVFKRTLALSLKLGTWRVTWTRKFCLFVVTESILSRICEVGDLGREQLFCILQI